MTLDKMKTLLNAEILYGEDDMNHDVTYAFSSDMMSDVLAYSGNEHSILITGLCNPQVVRTADLLDIECIVFVRDKEPDQNMLALAAEKNIVILSTEYGMFTTCGILYSNGILGGVKRDDE